MCAVPIQFDGDVGQVVLMVQLLRMIREGPVDEILELERHRSVHVDRIVVIHRSNHLTVVTIHATGVSVQAVGDRGPIDQGPYFSGE